MGSRLDASCRFRLWREVVNLLRLDRAYLQPFLLSLSANQLTTIMENFLIRQKKSVADIECLVRGNNLLAMCDRASSSWH